jgi:hypothetical protein
MSVRASDWSVLGTPPRMTFPHCRAVVVMTAVVVVTTLGGCSEDDGNGPGGSPPTLYRETIHIDPTPTTAP